MHRLFIAEAIVQGSKIAAVARTLGVSRSWASREANAPETRVVLNALVQRRAEAVKRQIDAALTTIENALKATIIGPPGQTVCVPDHGIRLEACSVFIKLISSKGFRSTYAPKGTSEVHSNKKASARHEEHADRPHADYKTQLESVRVLIRLLAKIG